MVAIERAEALGADPGPYQLQAAIAACHARASGPSDTNWLRIVGLYEELARVMPTPVVALNLAVAIGMASGPGAGLDRVDAISHEPALKNYHLLSSVRADFLEKLGRLEEASAEFRRAATLTRNERERALLLSRAAGCGLG